MIWGANRFRSFTASRDWRPWRDDELPPAVKTQSRSGTHCVMKTTDVLFAERAAVKLAGAAPPP
jgi:hypothetical protein